MQAALSVLAGVPARFQRGIGARLKGVVSTPGGVVAVFGHGLQVRLGNTKRARAQAARRRQGAGRDGRLDPAVGRVRQRLGARRAPPSDTRNKAKVEVETELS